MAVAQTPGTWLKGGAGGMWSADCIAALVACGINPDSFGSYSARAKAQNAARTAYRERREKEAEAHREGRGGRPHEASCPRGSSPEALCACHETEGAFRELGPERWFIANSESGHISQNAFYQRERDDPCSNMPPEGTHGGTYGYQMHTPLCMDHLGKSTRAGTMHAEISEREAAREVLLRRAQALRVTEEELTQNVRGTASLAARGSVARVRGTDPYMGRDLQSAVTAERHAGAAQDQRAQRAHAAALRQKYAAQGVLTPTGEVAGRTPNSPSTRRTPEQDADEAVECITAAWKQALDEMRTDAINKHSTIAKSKACKAEVAAYKKSLPPEERARVRGFTDLPPERQAKVERAAAPEVAARQAALTNAGAGTAGRTAEDGSPTRQDCLEYQANWLHQKRRPDGTFPPMEGRVPGPKKARPTPPPAEPTQTPTVF